MNLWLSTLNPFARLFSWRNHEWLDRTAGEVAEKCRANVWQRVRLRTSDMSMAELRGYVRAQAAAWIDGEIDHLACRDSWKPALRSRVTDTAVNRLISMVTHDALTDCTPASLQNMAA